MSDYIVSFIPAKATGEIDQETLNQCVDVIAGILYQKVSQGDKGFDPGVWSEVEVRTQITAEVFAKPSLFAPTLTEYPTGCSDYLEVLCNVCQQDVREWWASILKLDAEKQDYLVDQLVHPCPCGKTKVDLAALDYRDNPMYYTGFSIRMWHLFCAVCSEKKRQLLRKLEKLTGERLLMFEGYY